MTALALKISYQVPAPVISINQADPTRTLTLRNRFVADMSRRFKKLAKGVHESIVDNDAFGLSEEPPALFVMAAASSGQFDFPRESDKVGSFMAGLDEQPELYILSGGTRGISVTGVQSRTNWADVYVDSAYQQGIRRGRAELRKAGVDIPSYGGGIGQDEVQIAFNQPFHANRVGLIYTRTFNELKGITTSMDTKISRVLAEALAEGRGPAEISQAIEFILTGAGEKLGMLDSLGRFIPAKRRAEILARTEIIRAHHVATIEEYRQAGIIGVHVLAEWSTAGDNRVCIECSTLQGRIFPLNRIMGMIPKHPQCRCVALPHVGSKRKNR